MKNLMNDMQSDFEMSLDNPKACPFVATKRKVKGLAYATLNFHIKIGYTQSITILRISIYIFSAIFYC